MNGSKTVARIFLSVTLILSFAIGGVLVSGTQSIATTTATQGEITPVVLNEVCMVTDKVFGKPQIPVEYEGKTYYGCCQGCVAKLKNDSTLRSAVDPVSGNMIDKATATVIEGVGGEALYFESIDTAKKYFKQ